MLITEHLRRRLAHDGAAPLITDYDLDAGARTELSGVTFANWVAKAANLCVDELDLDTGDVVAMPLLEESPGHWMSLVWVMAAWSTGLEVVVGEVVVGEDRRADAVVVGPQQLDLPLGGSAPVLACSLHPLGLGFGDPLPAGWLDWSLEVRSQPDQFAGVPPTPELPAWSDAEQRLDQAGLAAGSGDAARRLVRPGHPWTTVSAALVAPLLGGGSAVVVSGGSEADVARVVADERTT